MSKSKQSGFTIIELLIVIVVIGVLAGIALVSYGRITDRAQAVVTKRIVQQYAKALAGFKVDNGRYPDETEMGQHVNRGCLGDGYSSTCGSSNSPVEVVPNLNLSLENYIGKTPNISPHDVPLEVAPDGSLSITLTGVAFYKMKADDGYDTLNGSDIEFYAISYALDEPGAKCIGGTVLELNADPNDFTLSPDSPNTLTDNKNTACFLKLPD